MSMINNDYYYYDIFMIINMIFMVIIMIFMIINMIFMIINMIFMIINMIFMIIIIMRFTTTYLLSSSFLELNSHYNF